VILRVFVSKKTIGNWTHLMKNPKPRVRRMVELLEARYGIPERPERDSPLDSMVLTILSQSTNDTNSHAAFQSLKRRFPSWRQAAEAPAGEIADAIRRGGLSNQKSKVIRDFLHWAKERFGSYTIDPICEMDEQEAYDLFRQVPGIGVKTVAVTLLFACRRDVFPVDTHVNRVCGRIGVVPPGTPPHKTHWLMQPHVPAGKAFSLHINLIGLGREICRGTPRCSICPLNRVCDYAREERLRGGDHKDAKSAKGTKKKEG